jgi:hypothetical protein
VKLNKAAAITVASFPQLMVDPILCRFAHMRLFTHSGFSHMMAWLPKTVDAPTGRGNEVDNRCGRT